jgi:WhiB family redox-sensing transcriptional regulator
LQGALSRKEPCGIWGGELFEDGVVIAAKRLPGRPKLIQEVFTSKLIDEKVLVASA